MWSRIKYFVLALAVVVLFAMTRGDLANIRGLATSTSFFTTQLAEVTRLEKEMLRFQSDASAYVHRHGGVTKDDVNLSFDILWSRVNTQWTKFVNPEIDTLRTYLPSLAEFSQALKDIDPLVLSLQPGEHEKLDLINQAILRYSPTMAAMNTDAYAELMKRSVGTATIQRDVMHSLDRIQWIFLIVSFSGITLMLWQLRRSERLYANLQKREAEIRSLATIDPLTGLSNRRVFDDRMRAIDDGTWAGECHLLLIDLDGFKAVNDTHGHEAGDHLLKEAANRIRLATGDRAVLARLGGDEFGIIVPGASDRAFGIAAAVIGALQTPVIYAARSLRVGASIGIASRRDGPLVSKTMLREADNALYAAKASGRNRYCVIGDVAGVDMTTRSAA